MIGKLGKYNELEMVRQSPHGVYLKYGEEEILLPNKYVPETWTAGDLLKVFVYKDSEDRLVATTLLPAGVLGEYVALTAVAQAPFGTFMDWGLEKHLLVPNSEMADAMEIGLLYVVRIMMDYRTSRLIGTTKIEAFLEVPEDLEEGQACTGIVYRKTDLGFNVVVNQEFIGLLYHNTIFEPIQIGQEINCFIDKVRTDGKVDLRLKKGALDNIDEDSQKILNYLQEHGGTMAITDKSSPEEISSHFGISKKAFKRAIGSLYKNRLIVVKENEITGQA